MEDAAENNEKNDSDEDDDDEEAVDMEAFEESGMLDTDQVKPISNLTFQVTINEIPLTC